MTDEERHPTIAEARKLGCPYAMSSMPLQQRNDRMCLADKCMAWRFRAAEETTGRVGDYRRGYCGLVGQP
jgi:hypothetical protein